MAAIFQMPAKPVGVGIIFAALEDSRRMASCRPPRRRHSAPGADAPRRQKRLVPRTLLSPLWRNRYQKNRQTSRSYVSRARALADCAAVSAPTRRLIVTDTAYRAPAKAVSPGARRLAEDKPGSYLTRACTFSGRCEDLRTKNRAAVRPRRLGLSCASAYGLHCLGCVAVILAFSCVVYFFSLPTALRVLYAVSLRDDADLSSIMFASALAATLYHSPTRGGRCQAPATATNYTTPQAPWWSPCIGLVGREGPPSKTQGHAAGATHWPPPYHALIVKTAYRTQAEQLVGEKK